MQEGRMEAEGPQLPHCLAPQPHILVPPPLLPPTFSEHHCVQEWAQSPALLSPRPEDRRPSQAPPCFPVAQRPVCSPTLGPQPSDTWSLGPRRAPRPASGRLGTRSGDGPSPREPEGWAPGRQSGGAVLTESGTGSARQSLGRDPSTPLCTPLVKVQPGAGALLAAPSLLWVRLRDRQRSFVAKGAGAIVLEGIQK